MGRIYKILPRAEWAQAQAAGRFEGSGIDRTDGYIHFSTAAQAGETARKHFAGRADLVVLEIEADDLGAGLVFFPHLYGVLDVGLVLAVTEAPLDADGVPQLGALG